MLPNLCEREVPRVHRDEGRVCGGYEYMYGEIDIVPDDRCSFYKWQIVFLYIIVFFTSALISKFSHDNLHSLFVFLNL